MTVVKVTLSHIQFAARVWLLSHIVSGLVSNSVAEIFGRKKSLMIDCLAFLIGYLLYGIGEDVTSLCVARAFLGYPLVNTVIFQVALNMSHEGHQTKILDMKVLKYETGKCWISTQKFDKKYGIWQ